MTESGGPVHRDSPAAEKIALFTSLFRGRGDVYPRRFESRKTGKSGYAPACANEWVRGICEKPRIQCAVCPNRRFLPVTDETIKPSSQAFIRYRPGGGPGGPRMMKPLRFATGASDAMLGGGPAGGGGSTRAGAG